MNRNVTSRCAPEGPVSWRERAMKLALLVPLAVTVLFVGQAQGEVATTPAGVDRAGIRASIKKEKPVDQRVKHADRAKAAARALKKGQLNPLMLVEQAAQPAAPGEAPRYFSHPNYANSSLPTVEGAVIPIGNALQDRAYASDHPVGVGALAPVFVVLPAALPDGMVQSFETWNQATAGASPFPSAGHVFHAYVLRPTGTANEYAVVFDSGLLTVPALTTPGTSEVATFGVANLAVQAGDRLAFFGQGIPLDTGSGSDVLTYPAVQPSQGTNITLGSTDYPVYPQARVYSFRAEVLDLSGQNTVITGGIRKFVDGLPGLGAGASNNLGQHIPVAVPDTTTYPGSDYYVIELGQYTEQLHSDLPNTTLRGYRQANMGGTPFHYLGPAIVAQKDRPVRVLFKNLLSTGQAGNLFIPVDTTVMGSGMGPQMGAMDEPDPQSPMCGNNPKPAGCYTENRATLHLHGGITPWISDGTPHQWITPAGESTPYPKGVSVKNVPDMPDPGPGAQTFFYTNQQSARLLFYHDHAWGITRLNVYAGEAAPYVLTDDTEQALTAATAPLGPQAIADTIPLVVQDKTFVPSTEQLTLQDETWDATRWGGEGSLWVPHVYSPAQNPGDASGVNQYGRWAYGPWFWPPTQTVKNGPIDNAYFDPNCDPNAGWCEPPLMPGTPFQSMGMEAFNDTPVVNGTAYPTVTLEPKSYRFRVLNAANDRFFNLSLYKAVDANGVVCDANNANPVPESTGVACTEVALNPAEVAAALEDPAGVFPTPDAVTAGPSWIQFGTEGGFLPSPVVVPAQPTTWVTDPTVFNAGNVDKHSLLLAPAERADVVVDLSQFAGHTLILYNDAPAAFPARDPRYDYYTGNADLRDTGGAPSTLPGYGPNTRTIMQIKVEGTPAPAFDLAALQGAFAHKADGSGAFEFGQNPIIVGQSPYNAVYGKTFASNGPRAGLVQIHDTSINFDTLAGVPLTIPLKPKQIQDEQGEAFDPDYGRMSGFLGVETPNAQAGAQNMILYPYSAPPSEVIKGVVPDGVDVTPIASADDGTQIWKITHNGVDTHPIHFHLYEIQLLNRVGWDGIIRRPDLNELGWKDTVRISPLEDTIVALRPIIPSVPFDLPNSVRLLNPALPAGAPLGVSKAPTGEPINLVNRMVNFGWEYVWHCHILSHEEMDMMRSQAVGIAPRAPTNLVATVTGAGANRTVQLTWTDNSANETSFLIERSTDPLFATGVTTFSADENATTFSNKVGNTSYFFRVYAVNTVGDTMDYNGDTAGGQFPTLTLKSDLPTVAPMNKPTNVAATAMRAGNQARVTVTWTDNTATETGFLVQRATNAGFTGNLTNATVGANVRTLTQTVARGTTFYYRVLAFNFVNASDWSNTATVATP